MRELSLFTGAGGGLLAGRLLGWTPIAAVEINPFCRQILAARQADGCLPEFPIHDDIRTFVGRPGMCDIVTGGFPCQPFSTAARGRNNAIDLWPDMFRIVRECAPRWVFAENVVDGPIRAAADDLASQGYRCAYMALSAADLGAPHERRRVWLAAHADADRQPHSPIHAKACRVRPTGRSLWWQAYPRPMGIPYGLAGRLDRRRLQALGNGQVPIVAATAWRILKKVLDDAAQEG